ncbi:MAG: cutinase family protein [Dactylosporangium sp.]|nr:cutinase family protein [Dactylosporangium sp.]NNJ60567.1 cutinase family protein [Dactylosporangium sp.]
MERRRPPAAVPLGLAALLAVAGVAMAACGPDRSDNVGATATPGSGWSAPSAGSSGPSSTAPPAPTATSAPPPVPVQKRPATVGGACASVKVIGARGTGESAGLGYLLSPVAKQIAAAVSTPVTSIGLDYPATADFVGSAQQGTTELQRLIAAETSACLVLLGYSQGAMVVGDALAAVGASGRKRIVAVVMFGDPRFNSAEPYNVGSYGKGSRGVYVRPSGQLSAFNSRIQNYCNGGDPVCQGTGASGSGTHLDYHQYADDAARFVAGQF